MLEASNNRAPGALPPPPPHGDNPAGLERENPPALGKSNTGGNKGGNKCDGKGGEPPIKKARAPKPEARAQKKSPIALYKP